MREILLFLGKLILFSLLALPTVKWFDGAYQGILQWGINDPSEIPFMGAHAIYIFFVLVLATPRLGLWRSALGIAAGILLYLVIDRLMIPVWKMLPYTQKPGPVPAKTFYTNVYYMLMHWLLPFMLWIGIAYRQIEEMCKGKVKEEAEE